jgi:hypothetical protein
MSRRGLVRGIEDGLCKRKLQHDLAVVVGDFQDCVQYTGLLAFGFQQLADGGSRHLPGMIGIAQFLALGIEDQFRADAGVKVIFGHDDQSYGWERARPLDAGISQVLY